MKTITFCLALALLGAVALSADTTTEDVLAAARADAASDTESRASFWWGLGAFGASAYGSLIGGGVLIFYAYSSAEQEMPPVRYAQSHEAYGDNAVAITIYEQEYTSSATKIHRRRNAAGAWIGTGLGAAVNAVLVYMLWSSLFAY